MPIVPFSSLPDDARIWIFAASDPLHDESVERLLAAVDEWLSEWKAHGETLTCARDWRDDRFLVIGVDQSAAGASGCSIDALFRVLLMLQGEIGSSLVGGGRVFYRTPAGDIESTTRSSFIDRAAAGALDGDTIVFDTSLTSAAAYRTHFTRRAGESWHRDLLPAMKH